MNGAYWRKGQRYTQAHRNDALGYRSRYGRKEQHDAGFVEK
jgi:hypothetical protein